MVFEGIDGSGKSTQARILADTLESDGFDVLLTAEPSDGPVGSVIRSVTKRLAPEEEARLFTEDRRDHVRRVIIPALNAGRIVVCDRYIFSSAAYQGARGIAPDTIIATNLSFAPLPDITFLLDLPVEAAIERIARSRPKGFSQFEVFKDLQAVQKIYRSLRDPSTVLIAAEKTVAEIQEIILGHVRRMIAQRGIGRKVDRGDMNQLDAGLDPRASFPGSPFPRE